VEKWRQFSTYSQTQDKNKGIFVKYLVIEDASVVGHTVAYKQQEAQKENLCLPKQNAPDPRQTEQAVRHHGH
jgi:hypothetical protein